MPKRLNTNKLVRDAIKDTKFMQYQIAEMLGDNEFHFCRKLRKELPLKEQIELSKKIISLKEEV